MSARPSVHECLSCPHLATSHRLLASAGIDGPYRCRYCGCEVARFAPTRLITYPDALRLHGSEIEDG